MNQLLKRGSNALTAISRSALTLFAITILATAANAQSSDLATVKCIDFKPAPGQFVNSLPSCEWYEEGDPDNDDLASMCEKVTTSQNSGSLVSLGTWGGYATLELATPITNTTGQYDFQVVGNSFQAAGSSTAGGSCEPGVIFVAQKDANGKPEKWYQICGSEYGVQKKITCRYSRYEHEAVKKGYATDLYYVKAEWLNGSTGEVDSITYVEKNNFHKQEYFPLFVTDSTYTGVLLPVNGRDESGKGTYYVQKFYEWGYADNQPNAYEHSKINIDWAVDDDGYQVWLDHIDFIKVQCGIFQMNGWLGECSTEISGIKDLHALGSDTETDVECYREDWGSITPVSVKLSSKGTLNVSIHYRSLNLTTAWSVQADAQTTVQDLLAALKSADDRLPDDYATATLVWNGETQLSLTDALTASGTLDVNADGHNCRPTTLSALPTTPTGISTPAAEPVRADRRYSIFGTPVGSGYRGLYIEGGRLKIAK